MMPLWSQISNDENGNAAATPEVSALRLLLRSISASSCASGKDDRNACSCR